MDIQGKSKEELFSLITENLHDVIWIVNTDLRCTFVSPSVERLLGYSTDEILRMKPLEMLTPTSAAMAHEIYNTLISCSRDQSIPDAIGTFELELYRKDGFAIWIEVVPTLLRDDQGNPMGAVAVTRDISLRKNSEGRLKDFQARLEGLVKEQSRQINEAVGRYQLLAENITDVIWTLDLDAKITFISPYVNKLIGYEVDDLMGRPIWEILSDSAFRLARETYNRELKLEQATGGHANRTLNLEFELARKDGSGLWIEARMTLLRDALGRPEGILGVSRDITERKLAEKRLTDSEKTKRALLNATNELVQLLDVDGRILDLNERACQALGGQVQDLIGKNAFNLIEPDIAERRKAAMREVIHTGRPLQFEDWSKDRWLFHNVYPIFNTARQVERLAIYSKDVTQLRKVEDELKESEKRYRLLAENSTDVIWTMNLSGQFTYVSPSSVHQSGYTPEEMLKKPLYAYLTPESFANANLLLSAELARSNQERHATRTMELQTYCKDGSILDVEITTSWVLDEHGNPIGLQGSTRDITDRKAAERALRESEERYRLLAENSTDVIWTMNLDGRFSYMSPSSTYQSGFTPEEMLQRRLEDHLTPESFAEAAQSIADEMHKPRDAQRTAITMELQHYHKDGSIIDVEITVSWIYDSAGNRVGLQGSTRTITARKIAERALRESEYKYRSLVESSDLGIFILYDGRFVYANESLCRIFGAPPEQIHSVDPVAFLLDDSRRLMSDAYRKWRDGIEVDSRYELEMKGQDGISRSILLHVRDLEFQGRPAVYGIIADQTRQKVLEAQLRLSQRMETVGALAGGIAHDLNNILQTIFNYTCHGLEQVPPKSILHEDLQGTLDSAKRAKKLIKQILTFSRRVEHRRRKVPLHLIVNEALEMLRSTIPAIIDIEQDIDETDDTIFADPSQIYQVVMNLCTNAFQAMQEKGGMLKVTVRKERIQRGEKGAIHTLDPGDYLCLTVQDTGVGMNESALSRIYEPFFTTRPLGEGTGLGLSVVLGIVEDHGGRILADSAIGKGSTFRVYLPGCEPEAEGEDREDEAPKSAVGGKENILYVDDEEEQVRLARRLLGSLGYTITNVSGSLEALELFRTSPDTFDVIVTDHMMPKMTGLELAREISHIRSDIPILLVTGNMEGSCVEKTEEYGVTRLITKPFRFNDLAVWIRQALNEKQKKGT